MPRVWHIFSGHMYQTGCACLRHQVQEVGDGNINFVYIVEGPSGALVVKQGLPYIRIAPEWPLTQVCSIRILDFCH